MAVLSSPGDEWQEELPSEQVEDGGQALRAPEQRVCHFRLGETRRYSQNEMEVEQA